MTKVYLCRLTDNIILHLQHFYLISTNFVVTLKKLKKLFVTNFSIFSPLDKFDNKPS